MTLLSVSAGPGSHVKVISLHLEVKGHPESHDENSG